MKSVKGTFGRASRILLVSFLVAASCLISLGCGASLKSAAGGEVLSTTSIQHFIKLPLCRQATDYTCGAAALQSILYYYGDEWGEASLADALNSNPDLGTNYHDIISVAQGEGLKAEAQSGLTLDALKAFIQAGKPVIVVFQAWSENPDGYADDWNDGHYAVAVGFDKNNIYFMDPLQLGNYTYIPNDEFLARWHDTDSDLMTKLIHFGIIIWGDESSYAPSDVLKLE